MLENKKMGRIVGVNGNLLTVDSYDPAHLFFFEHRINHLL